MAYWLTMSDEELAAEIKDARHWCVVVSRGSSASAAVVADTIKQQIRKMIAEKNTRATKRVLS